MLFARHPIIFALPCAGFLVAIYAVTFGVCGLVTGKIALTEKRTLTGEAATAASLLSIVLGLLLFALGCYGWSLTPE